LVRYEIGDFVEQIAGGFLVHGRKRDALRDAHGRLLTTRQVDTAFLDVSGIAHYQLRQQADGSAHLSLLPEQAGDELVAAQAMLQERLTLLLGSPVTSAAVGLLTPEDSGKFRLTVRESV
jgi:hypothetical protein